jgi:hypothetical protein
MMKRFLIRSLFLSLLILAWQGVSAQDSTRTRPWTLNGYLDDVQTVEVYGNNPHWIFNNLIHNMLNFKWQISPSFSTCVEMQNRFEFGNYTELLTDYYGTYGNDNGVVDLSWNVVSGPSYVLNLAFDRAYIDYSKGKFEATVGRQRVNWGVSSVWNPNDIFNTYSYLQFDYDERPGCDAVRLQFYPGTLGRAEFTVKASKDWLITAAGLYAMNVKGYDLQFLAGVMDGDNAVVGAGWAGQIAKGGFRGEMSYFHPVKNFGDTTGVFTGTIGYDYTFRNSLMLQGEVLYNGNPNGKISTLLLPDQNTATGMSAMNPFLSDVTVFAGVTYPFHPLFTASLAGMYNWDNAVYIIIPSATLSVTNEIDLTLLSQIFETYSGDYPIANLEYFFLRFKWSF